MAIVSVPAFAPAEPSGRTLANRISPDHFRVYGTPLLTGREFDERDTADAPLVAIVNRAFADRYFDRADPVGKTIILNKRPTTIIGLALNAKHLTLRDAAEPFVYAPIAQWSFTTLDSLRFSVRIDRAVLPQATIVNTLRELNPEWSLEIRRLTDDVGGSVNVERLLAWCGGVFALLALSIGVVGTYGIFAYDVARRRREIGIRMALGATPQTIGRAVLQEASTLIVVGSVVGLAATWAESWRGFCSASVVMTRSP